MGGTVQPGGTDMPLGPEVLHHSLILQNQSILFNRNAENKPIVSEG